MVINNASLQVVKLFVADPAASYNIREIAKKTRVNYRLVHDAVFLLEKEKFLQIKNVGNIKLCSFIPGGNKALSIYAETERTQEFLNKNFAVNIIKQEVDKKMRTVYDTILIFGSYAKGKQKQNSDIDILCIIPEHLKREHYEKHVLSIFRLLHYKVDVNVMTEIEFIAAKKENGINIAKESISNHIILRGAEQFHYLLAK